MRKGLRHYVSMLNATKETNMTTKTATPIAAIPARRVYDYRFNNECKFFGNVRNVTEYTAADGKITRSGTVTRQYEDLTVEQRSVDMGDGTYATLPQWYAVSDDATNVTYRPEVG